MKTRRGVPISAIVFGGRRAKLAPLVYEARDRGDTASTWEPRWCPRRRPRPPGAVGVPRNDPMAMLPFCGYNMADYFRHWLAVGKSLRHPPKIFHVNWFRTSSSGKYLWPGFGENIRVLKWIFSRVAGVVGTRETPIGLVPSDGSLDLSRLDLTSETLDRLMAVDVGEWLEEARRSEDFLAKFGDRLPRIAFAGAPEPRQATQSLEKLNQPADRPWPWMITMNDDERTSGGSLPRSSPRPPACAW